MKIKELLELVSICKNNGATDESIIEFHVDNVTYDLEKVINNEDVVNVVLEIKK